SIFVIWSSADPDVAHNIASLYFQYPSFLGFINWDAQKKSQSEGRKTTLSSVATSPLRFHQ
ncbi:hypothetical protein OAN24_05700, partial [Pseudodesulfovibrio sp.]|nr:hypothetical protein [Pseudodesulfovibrio sp.]